MRPVPTSHPRHRTRPREAVPASNMQHYSCTSPTTNKKRCAASAPFRPTAGARTARRMTARVGALTRDPSQPGWE